MDIAIDQGATSTAPHSGRAVLGWALIVLVALMSFYVHVLQQQVENGARVREQLRLAPRIAARTTKRADPAGLRLARAEAER
jgi:hypothetical protein